MAAEHLWKPDLEDGTYKNPVLYADYSDPDVVRAGDTYYMTASSFNYVPGLPILTSKDLVNWTLVNYALTQINDRKYDMPQYAKGVWAPAIRYHGRLFEVVCPESIWKKEPCALGKCKCPDTEAGMPIPEGGCMPAFWRAC